jgi:ketosteroid isomerase-like protein
MRKTARLVPLLVIAITLVNTRSNAADPAPDVAALHAADDGWVKAYNGGDVDAATAFYDEHAVLLPPGAPAATGRAAIRAFLAKAIAESSKAGIRFFLDANPAGGVSGSMGWSSGSYAVKDKSGKVLETGKYLSVSRMAGGRWLYVRDIWNADGPPPTSEAPPLK